MNGNYGWGLPVQASTFAKEIDFGIYFIHGAMLLIFALWSVFFVYLLARYRRRPGVPAEPPAHEGVWKSLIPDAFVLVFELALIAFYALPGWSRIKMSLPDPGRSEQMEVVAEQFAWNVHYPGPDGKFGRRDPRLVDSANPIGLDPADPAAQDDLLSVNELHVPLGRPTVIQLTSKDVVHSFFIPEFRVKQDAVPGLRTPLWFEPTLQGRFELGCAQLCGVGHALMRGDVYAQPPEEYASWLKAQTPLLANR